MMYSGVVGVYCLLGGYFLSCLLQRDGGGENSQIFISYQNSFLQPNICSHYNTASTSAGKENYGLRASTLPCLRRKAACAQFNKNKTHVIIPFFERGAAVHQCFCAFMTVSLSMHHILHLHTNVQSIQKLSPLSSVESQCIELQRCIPVPVPFSKKILLFTDMQVVLVVLVKAKGR